VPNAATTQRERPQPPREPIATPSSCLLLPPAEFSLQPLRFFDVTARTPALDYWRPGIHFIRSESYLSLPEHNPHAASSRHPLRLLWFLMAVLFVVSLISSITMIVQTINWLRVKASAVPAWFHPLITLSEWGLALSSLGLLVLAGVTIVRGYRDRQR